MERFQRLKGRRILAAAALTAATACSGLALAPAASADSAAAPATTSSTAHTATVHPETGAECTQGLISFGYKVTTTRGLICFVAASPLGNPPAKFVACVGAMKATGVGIIATNYACQLAVYSEA